MIIEEYSIKKIAYRKNTEITHFTLRHIPITYVRCLFCVHRSIHLPKPDMIKNFINAKLEYFSTSKTVAGHIITAWHFLGNPLVLLLQMTYKMVVFIFQHYLFLVVFHLQVGGSLGNYTFKIALNCIYLMQLWWINHIYLVSFIWKHTSQQVVNVLHKSSAKSFWHIDLHYLSIFT